MKAIRCATMPPNSKIKKELEEDENFLNEMDKVLLHL